MGAGVSETAALDRTLPPALRSEITKEFAKHVEERLQKKISLVSEKHPASVRRYQRAYDVLLGKAMVSDLKSTFEMMLICGEFKKKIGFNVVVQRYTLVL